MLNQFVYPTKFLPTRHSRITPTRRIHTILILRILVYEGCPEGIRPFWISREPVAWRVGGDLSANLWTVILPRGASQSAVRRQWLSLCTVCPSHSQWPSEQIRQYACPFYSYRAVIFFDVLTSIVSFYTGPQSRGGVAYGVTSLQANRNTITKASRRGVATSTTRWRHIMDTTMALLRKQQDGGTSWISQRQFERTY
jgi:hypothetical protein